MMIKENERNKILVFDDYPERHDKLLSNKIIQFLSNKYRNPIKERNFNINNFQPKLMKEIKNKKQKN